jgi:modulator of FtsH protease
MSIAYSSGTDVGEASVFGQVMGLVATTLGGLIVYGLVSLFVSMPAGNVIYAVLGFGIFGAYTLLDFNRLRNAGPGDAVSIATGIFLDILNVFTFFLQLFGHGQQD